MPAWIRKNDGLRPIQTVDVGRSARSGSAVARAPRELPRLQSLQRTAVALRVAPRARLACGPGIRGGRVIRQRRPAARPIAAALTGLSQANARDGGQCA